MRMVTHRQNGIISVVVLFHLAILEMSSLQATLLVDDVPTINTYINKEFTEIVGGMVLD